MLRVQPKVKKRHLIPVCSQALMVVLLSFSTAYSDFGKNEIGHTKLTADKLPNELKDIGIDEHRGQNIDLNLTFQDESGKSVQLKSYFTPQKPVLLALVYFGCPNICTFVLNGITDSLKKVDLKPGEKFEVIAVSIDPSETPQLASEKKKAYLKEYGIAGTESGWHFLVGKQPQITALTQQIGFRYKWVEETKQFAHGSAIFLLTPEGKISRYLYGIQYQPRDVKMALLEASNGKIGTFVDRIMLFCFYYDVTTKKYVLLASRIMTGGGILTLLLFGIFLGRLWSRERKQKARSLEIVSAQKGSP
ncbi:MAG: SCO family protein [Oligoflexia bacterium]|nr:SCO family protein [Oligoflexia bacterium]